MDIAECSAPVETPCRCLVRAHGACHRWGVPACSSAPAIRVCHADGVNDKTSNRSPSDGTPNYTPTAFVGSKGGVGTTCVTVVAASAAQQAGSNVVLVDFTGDLGNVLGVAPNAPGFADWADAGDMTREALDALMVPVGPNVLLLPIGTYGDLSRISITDRLAVPRLWEALGDEQSTVFVDAGHGAEARDRVLSGTRTVLVTAACHQSVFRSKALASRCDEMVVVLNPERVLVRNDIETALERRAVLTFEHTASVGRMADSARLLERGWRYLGDPLPAHWQQHRVLAAV